MTVHFPTFQRYSTMRHRGYDAKNGGFRARSALEVHAVRVSILEITLQGCGARDGKLSTNRTTTQVEANACTL
jgi:hypothetical protein